MCTATEKTYTVEGMTCGHCELTVRDAVRQAVQAAGYNVTPANTPAKGSDEDLEVSR